MQPLHLGLMDKWVLFRSMPTIHFFEVNRKFARLPATTRELLLEKICKQATQAALSWHFFLESVEIKNS